MKNWTRISFIAGLFAIIATFLSLTRIWSNIGGQNKVDDAAVVGTWVMSHGNVRIQSRHSSIWRKVNSRQPIFLGDLAQTDIESTAEIELLNGTKINILKNTEVYFLRDEGGLFLSILRGLVEVTPPHPNAVRIFDGREIMDSYRPVEEQAKPLTQATPEPRPKSTAPQSTPQPELNEISKPAQVFDSGDGGPVDFPQPRLNSVLFYRASAAIEVEVRPIKICLRPCRLSVSSSIRGDLIEKNFKTGQAPEAKFSTDPKKPSERIDWTLESSPSQGPEINPATHTGTDKSPDKVQGSFEIAPFNTRLFKNSLKDGKAIEILN